MKFTRFAIFYTPPPSPLATFGAAWLGWDAPTGKEPERAEIPDLPLPWDEITRAPRKYGFHGTIKPPFRLAEGQKPEAIEQALSEFCARRAAVSLDRLELAQLGRFLALVPVGDTKVLNDLAADAVRAFDPFRASPNEQELTRRRRNDLSAHQNALLQKWGYPYVMEAFRFHLTLTGKLPKAQATRLRALLDPCLAPLLLSPFVFDALSLLGEAPDGKFHLIHRFPLSGSG